MPLKAALSGKHCNRHCASSACPTPATQIGNQLGGRSRCRLPIFGTRAPSQRQLAEYRRDERASGTRPLRPPARPPGKRHALPDHHPGHYRPPFPSRLTPGNQPGSGRTQGYARSAQPRTGPLQRIWSVARPWPRPRPWPSVQSRRSLTPLPGHDSRPPYVRGSPDAAAPAGTKRHTPAHRRNSPLAEKIQLAGIFAACGTCWVRTNVGCADGFTGRPCQTSLPPLTSTDALRGALRGRRRPLYVRGYGAPGPPNPRTGTDGEGRSGAQTVRRSGVPAAPCHCLAADLAFQAAGRFRRIDTLDQPSHIPDNRDMAFFMPSATAQ